MTAPEPVPGDLAEALAGVHVEAFDRPWDAAIFADLLAQPGVFVEAEADGFILCRTAADEVEVLTLAVRPAARRRGIGARLVAAAALSAARAGAERLLLEVAVDNAPALALYLRAGFVEVGRRPAYYARPDGQRVEALILALNCAGRLPTP